MKKLPVFLMMLAVAGLISSCKQNVSTPQANLTNEMDSLAYAIGVARTQGLTQYLMQSDIDSSYTEEFIKGFNEGAVMGKNDVKKMAYVMGIQIGQQFGNQMLDQLNQQIFGADSAQQLSKNNFIAGFDAAALNKNLKMSVEEASIYFETKIQALETKKMEKEFGFNRDAGYAFLEENKTKEGVVTLPSGLQYKVITQGKGAIPTTKDVVKVNYVGTLIDGTEFDSSYKRGEPATFATTGVIEGWTEALTMMPVGSKWMLYIPQELAYGAQRQGNINPFSTLVFEVELLDIVPQPAVK